MAERTEYAPGTFCWVDLGARDPAAAMAFYAAVLGWQAGPESHGYRMCLVDGHAVAGIHRAATPTPVWTSHVSVADVDASAARARALGATVRVEPTEVMDLGRTALIVDPQGAAVGLWQPGAMAGAGMVNDPGALTLNQLNTHDPTGSTVFYIGLFGWDVVKVVEDPFPYWGIQNGGRLNGGMMGLAADNPAPSHWLPYFTVEDVDGADAAIVDAGGMVVVPVMPAGEGRILVALDPQGAAFAVFEGRVDP